MTRLGGIPSGCERAYLRRHDRQGCDTVSLATAFDGYQPIWIDECAGYNIIIDIGMFLGEYLISKRPHLRWQFHSGNDLAPAGKKHWSYLRPIIGGFPRSNWAHDVLGDGYGAVAESRFTSHVAHDRMSTNPDGTIS